MLSHFLPTECNAAATPTTGNQKFGTLLAPEGVKRLLPHIHTHTTSYHPFAWERHRLQRSRAALVTFLCRKSRAV